MLSNAQYESYKRQIQRMLSNMSWQQICSIGEQLIIPVMLEHGQLNVGSSSQSGVISNQARAVMESLFKQATSGDPAAARVFLQESARFSALEDASNVIINIVPYDVQDKVKVEIPGYEGNNYSSVSDAEEVLICDT